MRYPISIHKTHTSRLPETDFNNLPFGKTFSDHLFIAEYRDGAWQDCRIEPFEAMRLSPANMALHYGQSVFEGLKATCAPDGKPHIFRIEAHAERMRNSAYRMGMPELPIDLFIQAVETLVAVDYDWIPTLDDTSLYIRPFAFAADEFLGVRPSDTYKFMIITGPVGAYYNAPVKLYASDKYVRAFPGGTGEAKSAGNYGATLLAVREIREKGYDQMLWLDGIEHKYIHEVGTMNLFFVIGDKVLTPALNGCILAGVTRDAILTILAEKGIACEVREINIDEIVEAHHNGSLKEVFGAGTAAVIQHVSTIHYNGVDMELTPATERPISAMLYDTIVGIRSGNAPDPHGWSRVVHPYEMKSEKRAVGIAD